MPRRKYSDEYKREAVGMVQQPGMIQAQIARDLGISPSLLGRWIQAFRESGELAFPGKGSPGIRSLRSSSESWPGSRRNGIFLRDAATFFAQERK